MYMGIQWGILENPGIYLAGAPINWQDINKFIWVSSEAYWNTMAFIWQEHGLTGRILINLYGHPVDHIATYRRLSVKITNKWQFINISILVFSVAYWNSQAFIWQEN